MPEHTLEITLTSDAILSVHPSTTTAESLSYIPGATLLGAAAARVYTDLAKKGAAFSVFHSGEVRFGAGYPLAHGEATLPVPFCWHSPKGKPWQAAGRVVACDVWNLALPREKEIDDLDRSGVQLRQIREGFVAANGRLALPEVRVSMKTALDPNRRLRAKDEKLFVYQGLRKGGRYLSTIQASDSAPSGALEQVIEVLTGRGIRLGRSRSAEYGAVKISMADKRPVGSEGNGKATRHVFYCASDVAFFQPHSGLPTLCPQPEQLGLPPSADLVPELTFIRTRRYAPFNAKRRSPSLEREVVVAGSVIVFDTREPVDASQPRTALAGGVGSHLAEGLGWLLHNPTFLDGLHPTFDEESRSEDSEETGSPAPPEGPLLDWVRAAREDRNLSDMLRRRVEELLLQHRGTFLDRNAPSASQWGQIGVLARSVASADSLHEALFGEEGYCNHGVTAEAWRTDRKGSPGHRLQEILRALRDDAKLAPRASETVVQLVHRVQRAIAERKKG